MAEVSPGCRLHRAYPSPMSQLASIGRPSRAAIMALLALRLLSGSFLYAQPRQSPEGPDYLTLDFRAIGSDGRLVTDLTEKDITVRIDGRARGIRSLQLITVAETATPDAPVRPPLPPPFATSRPTGGRSLILALDD